MSPVLKNSKKSTSAMDLAIRYLAYQPRTKHEIKEYLKKKKINKETINEVIHSLLEKNYLNDMEFSTMFVQSRARHKPKSRFALGYDLKKKGVKDTVIDQVLHSYDDEMLAKKAIKIKLHQWLSLDNEAFKKKIMNHLRYRGFGYEICLQTLNRFLTLRENQRKG